MKKSSARTKPGLCFIVRQGDKPPESILTLRFPGETENDVKRHLDDALATLPFATLYSYITFGSTDDALELLDEASVENVVDSPGAEEVSLTLKVEYERKFFLPRDPETREFVNITEQVQCLKVLKRQ